MNKFLIIVAIIFSPMFVSAQSPIDLLSGAVIGNFGGVVVMSVPCTCTGSFIMYVLDVRQITSIANIEEVLKIRNVTDLKNFSPSIFKKIMVFPLTFSRMNLFGYPLVGNSVLGTYIDMSVFTSKLGKAGLAKMGIAKDKYLNGCWQVIPVGCVKTPFISADGVVTPRPLSGMGTSQIPL